MPSKIAQKIQKTPLLWMLLFAFFIAFIALVCLYAADFILKKTYNASYTTSAVDPELNAITLALGSEPPQLDSTKSTDQASFFILGHVMEGLLRYGENGSIQPAVAERWVINDQNATFYLRKSARWSNGDPVTAHDFVFSWQKAVDPNTASQYAFIFYYIKNAQSINEGKLPKEQLGVQAVDDYTLRVELNQPVAFFDKLVAFGLFFPINESFYKKHKANYGAEYNTLLYNGPFTMTKWLHGAHITLEKNPHYWHATYPIIDVIDIPYITADINAITNLYRDEKIAISGLNAEKIDLALRLGWPIHSFSSGALYFLELNHRPSSPTHNWDLRRALQLVYNPSDFVNKVLRLPGNKPTTTIFPSWLKGVTKTFQEEYPPPQHEVNLSLAQHHLAKAKEALGGEIPPLILLTGDSDGARKHAEYLQYLYSETLGLTIKIDAQIFKLRLSKMTQGSFDIVAAGWGPDYDDPLTFGDLFASWNLNNRGRYNQPEVDQWVRLAQNSLSPELRMEAFDKIQHLIYRDVAIIPTHESGGLFVMHEQLINVKRRRIGHDPDFTYARIASDQLKP